MMNDSNLIKIHSTLFALLSASGCLGFESQKTELSMSSLDGSNSSAITDTTFAESGTGAGSSSGASGGSSGNSSGGGSGSSAAATGSARANSATTAEICPHGSVNTSRGTCVSIDGSTYTWLDSSQRLAGFASDADNRYLLFHTNLTYLTYRLDIYKSSGSNSPYARLCTITPAQSFVGHLGVNSQGFSILTQYYDSGFRNTILQIELFDTLCRARGSPVKFPNFMVNSRQYSTVSWNYPTFSLYSSDTLSAPFSQRDDQIILQNSDDSLISTTLQLDTYSRHQPIITLAGESLAAYTDFVVTIGRSAIWIFNRNSGALWKLAPDWTIIGVAKLPTTSTNASIYYPELYEVQAMTETDSDHLVLASSGYNANAVLLITVNVGKF